ncbi:replication initiation protein [Nocardia sp. NPDC004711]
MQLDADESVLDSDMTLFDFEQHWLPRRPYAAKDKHGPYYRTSRERALAMPYLEANPSALRSLIITDHDGGCADEVVGLAGLPPPSYIALNPITNDGHIVYALAEPVTLTNVARRAPVNLLARIEAALNDVLAGDPAYGLRMTKNPMHQAHLTFNGPEYAVYGLRDLAGPLDTLGALPKFNTPLERRKKLETTDVGRNVDLFELHRKWAYRRVRDYQHYKDWLRISADHCWDRNMDTIGPAYSKGPMLPGETNQLSRSVARWTWLNIQRTFSEEQSRRAKRNAELAGSEELARRGRRGGIAAAQKLTAEELVERARKGGSVRSEAKREAARRRATKYDMSAIVAAALEEG